MKLYKTKLGRIINFIKNEGKFKRSDYVKVMQNTSKRKDYDKYVGQRAIFAYIPFILIWDAMFISYLVK